MQFCTEWVRRTHSVNPIYKIPGVLAEKGLADRFSVEYCSKIRLVGEEHMEMNLLTLTNVLIMGNANGILRPLREDDIYFVPYWEVAFTSECGLEKNTLSDQIEKVKNRVSLNKHYIWEDKIPVSQAIIGRNLINGVVVNGVYTPPMFRRKGYATSCVANVSRLILDSGNKFCCLFADAMNPVSNKIYNKIGYKHVCIYLEVKFI